MNDRDNSAIFPYPWPWEDFEPTVVSLRTLREDPRYFIRFETAAAERLISPALNRVSFTEIAESLTLDDERRRSLAFDFELIASWYLGPQVQRTLNVDVDSCRKELGLAAEIAGDLSSALRKIESMIGPAFQHYYAAIGKVGDASNVFNDLDGLLANVNRVSRELMGAIPKRGRGRPEGFFREKAISLVCDALKEAGAEDVTISHGKGHRAGADLHFSNQSGQVLAALFKLMHPQMDESLLVRSIDELRREGRTINLAEK